MFICFLLSIRTLLRFALFPKRRPRFDPIHAEMQGGIR
jgi:hypothetical protein